jgi:hypothetical protein
MGYEPCKSQNEVRENFIEVHKGRNSRNWRTYEESEMFV